MNEIETKCQSALEAISKFQPRFLDSGGDRTMTQLRQFVVGKECLPGRQWAQIILEIKTAWNELRRMMLDREEQQEKGKGTDLESRRANLRQEQIEFEMTCKLREIDKMLAIATEMKPYTRVQMEAEEQDYYLKRLKKQALLGKAANDTGFLLRDLEALEQFGAITIFVKENKLMIEELMPLGMFQKQLESK